MKNLLPQKLQNIIRWVSRAGLLAATLLPFAPSPMLAADKWVVATMAPGVENSDAGGNSATSPALFTVARVNKWIRDTGAESLTIHFKGGQTYEIVSADTTTTDERILLVGDINTQIALVGDVGTEQAPLTRPVLHMKASKTTVWPPTGVMHDHLISVSPWFPFGSVYLGKIDIQNLVLDGDFDNQGLYSSAANMVGYKSAACTWVPSRAPCRT